MISFMLFLTINTEGKDKQKLARFMQFYGESLEGKAHGTKSHTTVVVKQDEKGKNGKAEKKVSFNIDYLIFLVLELSSYV